jgi:hypothetical protein
MKRLGPLLLILLTAIVLWAAAPSFIQESPDTAWDTTTTPKTTSSFSVQNGDILVAYAACEDSTNCGAITITDNTSTSGNWVNRQTVSAASYTEAYLWTKVVTATESMTVTLTRAPNASIFGGDVLTFRGSDGVGATAQNHATGAAPTVDLTTTQANSAIVVVNSDWAAGTGSRTWRTNAGTFTEVSYQNVNGNYTIYGGYHADAGSVATYAVGLSAPTQTYSVAAVEVKGAAAGGGAAPKRMLTLGVGAHNLPTFPALSAKAWQQLWPGGIR